MKKFTTDLVKQYQYNPRTGKFGEPKVIISEELPSTIIYHEGWLYVTGRGTVRRWKHLSAITQEHQENILSRSLVDRARRQIGLFTSILLVVSAVIIALIIYTMTMEKMRQIAMLKLIGAPDRTIVGMIVQQALALGIIGFSIGAGLIVGIKDYFPRRGVLEPDNVMLLGAVVFAVCLVASGLGVRAALKVEPATALGG